MPPNDSSSVKPTMKKGHPNPERLDQTIEIIEAPSKVFIFTSAFTVGALMVWSVLAEIPSTVPAQAVFIQPQTIQIIQSTGNGQFFFKDDISANTSQQINKFISIVSDEMNKMLYNPNLVTSPETTANISDSINTFFKISTQASKDTKQLSSTPNSYQKPSFVKAGDVYAYILNEQTALNFASQLGIFSQQNIYSNLATNGNQKLLNQGGLIDAALVRRVNTLQALAKQGIVAQSTILQAKQQVLQQNQSNTTQSLTLQSTKSDKSESLAKLLGNIVASTKSIQIRSNEDLIILSRLVSSGSYVTSNQNVAIATNSTSTPFLISCFIPGVSFSGVKRGSKVLVSPENVDENTYGSIVGTVENVSSVGLGADDAKTIIGVPSVISTIFRNQPSLFFATIRLQKSETFTGYKWTSSNGPSFQIPRTTIANVKLVTNTYKPFQLVLPFIKSITGNS
jgi:HlyD family secretion protein